MSFKKCIAILGSTGSIGRQTLEVVDQHPDRFQVVALAAHSNVTLLREQIQRYHPQLVAVWDAVAAEELRMFLDSSTVLEIGRAGLIAAASHPSVDTVVNAVVGMVGLEPTLAALRAKKTVALANKETLVAAGELVMSTAAANQTAIVPLDSEHSAIFQCLQGHTQAVQSLILTASGGPFLHSSLEELSHATADQALRHPNWSMGKKITIDSATMFNKGLEVIEARWLFDVEPEKIQVVVHPQSIIHSMVEFEDNSVLAQLGNPDMRLPIQYALSHPERWSSASQRLSLPKVGQLTFEEPDLVRFPALQLAYEALALGKTAPTVLNAADEVAVAAFLEGQISFRDIVKIVESVVTRFENWEAASLEAILKADLRGRQLAKDAICQR